MTTTSNPDSSPAVATAVMPKLPVTLDTQRRLRTSKEQRRLILAEFEVAAKPSHPILLRFFGVSPPRSAYKYSAAFRSRTSTLMNG
jgi:hypothetical protein